jgi:hypothetical protein
MIRDTKQKILEIMHFEYGIKKSKRILPNLLDWTKENGESYAELDELYGAYRTI